ncbi:hypothetical protein Poli38472_005697 [Pythium oligandrum]|uniref:Pentatricopeptide repeat-containing protein n=1 Tax=Pythium oligandrum TaxID=41045 RepID=A0A8K1CHD1_PYTOL|nr:hypothetical protein Poli38472_005697 [Pythium oligandrum]|eukprot:TMW63079.1 hypothetical protein Poli38472_005697 [Pythium oligandrum]
MMRHAWTQSAALLRRQGVSMQSAASVQTAAGQLQFAAHRRKRAGPHRPRHGAAAPPTGPPGRRLRQQDLSHKRPAPLRVADQRIGMLLTRQTPPSAIQRICEELGREDEVELLSATEPKVWNVALQNRLVQDDVDGAKALLQLLSGFAAENMSEQLWNDLLFTLLRQRSSLSREKEVRRLLDTLKRACGAEFVANVIVSTVNGCANIKMFEEARFLVMYHLELKSRVPLPRRIMGNLMSNMQIKRRYEHVVEFASDLMLHKQTTVNQIQPQFWIALFQSCAQTRANPSRFVDQLIVWFDAVKTRPMDEKPQFERVFGAAIQCCVSTGHERLALRCYHAMVGEEEEEEGSNTARVCRPDENIYVNVLKAARALHDTSLFVDVYRAMVRDRVARSAGFGTVIRFCHEQQDVELLEEVLEQAFTVEESLRGRWILPIEQYNDALGCFAETKAFDSAKELFSRVVASPVLKPDHVTMVEMVENYREAPFSDVFELMELFLELDISPNLHVFTSLLATCGRRRLINDAMALMDAMKAQGVEPDVKAFTAAAFIFGTHGHLEGIIGVFREMAARNIEGDGKFFDTIMDGLYEGNGIDMCFSLFQETLAAGLKIPQRMYASLIRVGTRVGLIERTLHIAYNMECEGFPLGSDELLGLIRRCEASTEVKELLRTFILLHAEQPMDSSSPRFSFDVYDEMIDLLGRFSLRDGVSRVQRLAEQAGYSGLAA